MVDMIVTTEDFDRLPDVLFHATSYDYLDSISQYGLGGNRGNQIPIGCKPNETISNLYDGVFQRSGFFLAMTEEEAYIYASCCRENICLLGVEKRLLDRNKLYYDTNNICVEEYLECRSHRQIDIRQYPQLTFFYNGIIENPQSKLEIYDY